MIFKFCKNSNANQQNLCYIGSLSFFKGKCILSSHCLSTQKCVWVYECVCDYIYAYIQTECLYVYKHFKILYLYFGLLDTQSSFSHLTLYYFIFLKFIYFIYLFLAVLGPLCRTRTFSSCGEQGLLFVAVRGLLIAMASLVAEHGL